REPLRHERRFRTQVFTPAKTTGCLCHKSGSKNEFTYLLGGTLTTLTEHTNDQSSPSSPCATAFAAPRRSSHAISESWSVAGIASGGPGLCQRSGSPGSWSRPDSSTIFLREFFDEQRHAIGLRHNPERHGGRRALLCGDACHHGHALLRREASEGGAG